MVEPIQSAEKIGEVRLSLGEAPKHTQDEHVGCAFYPRTALLGDVNVFIGMKCPHDVDASGAFYSEDYVRLLKNQL